MSADWGIDGDMRLHDETPPLNLRGRHVTCRRDKLLELGDSHGGGRNGEGRHPDPTRRTLTIARNGAGRQGSMDHFTARDPHETCDVERRAGRRRRDGVGELPLPHGGTARYGE